MNTNHYFSARQNTDGSWYLNEYRWDEQAMLLRRETIADDLSRPDAELLVKKGNQFLFLLEYAQREMDQ